LKCFFIVFLAFLRVHIFVQDLSPGLDKLSLRSV